MAGLEIVFWYWLVLATFLLVLEMLTGSFFFLWLAISGIVAGIELYLIPSTSLEIQLLLFSVLCIISTFLWRHCGFKHGKTDRPFLNKRGAQYIGRTFTLSEPIENGKGRINIDGSIWTVQGTDCPLETKVKVTALNGTLFEVELVKNKAE